MSISRIVLPVIIALTLSCNNESKTAIQDVATDSAKICCSKEIMQPASPGTIPGESVFNITSQWQTQNKQTFQLSEIAGKVTIAAMIFTSCQSACPRIMADIKRIESALSADELTKVRFLLITMDPENDTPGRLKDFKKEHQLNDNWTLICSNEDATMEMANVLGVRIKKLSDGGFDHSNTVFVLDQRGVVTHKQDGLGGEPSETIKSIKKVFSH